MAKARAEGKVKVCPITRGDFRKSARPVTVTIDGKAMVGTVKEFESGSLGWNVNGKTVIEVGGVPCEVQCGANFTIIHSKELPK